VLPALWVLGNLTIDDVVMADGATAFGQGGGNAIYAARGAAVWTDGVGIAARIGPDYAPEHVEQLRGLGLELHLVQVASPTIRHWALYESTDVRQFVLRPGSGTHRDQSVRADELPPMTPGGACHIAPMPPDIQSALIDAVRDRSAVLSLDPHDDYVAAHSAQLLALLPRLTVFLPSRREAELLFGRDDPEAAATAFREAGAEVVAVKLGTEGSVVTAGERGAVHVPAVDVPVTDPTGAGDAYCGGFTAAYLATRDPLAAACHATVSASLIVETRGATSPIAGDRAAAVMRLEALLERLGASVPT
jgi:sugar/nucleoside kinase (ribokinase family)